VFRRRSESGWFNRRGRRAGGQISRVKALFFDSFVFGNDVKNKRCFFKQA
jgi:hypothetical protein